MTTSVNQPTMGAEKPKRPAASVATTDTPKMIATMPKALRMGREFGTASNRLEGPGSSVF